MCLQETYSTTAINYDFALITLQADASPGLGYFGIERGQAVIPTTLHLPGTLQTRPLAACG